MHRKAGYLHELCQRPPHQRPCFSWTHVSRFRFEPGSVASYWLKKNQPRPLNAVYFLCEGRIRASGPANKKKWMRSL